MYDLYFYVIQSTLLLSAMYIPYVVLMRRDTFFRFNRITLLTIMLVALLMPALHIAWLRLAALPPAPLLNEPNIIDELSIRVHELASAQKYSYNNGSEVLIPLVYALGALSVVAWRGWQLAMLYRMMRRESTKIGRYGGINIHVSSTIPGSFSWMNHVVLNMDDYAQGGSAVLRHELAHARLHLSWDALLQVVVQAVQWFNPLAWLIGYSLSDVHEYEADSKVPNRRIRATDYQRVLLNHAERSVATYAYAHGFHDSMLGKRIRMMLSERTRPWKRAKVAAVAAMGLFWAAVVTAKGLPYTGCYDSEMGIVYDEPEVLPAYDGHAPGDYKALWAYLANNVRRPEAMNATGKRLRLDFIFAVRADGSLSHIRRYIPVVTAPEGAPFPTTSEEEEALEAMKHEADRLLREMGPWQPGRVRERPVNTMFQLHILF